MAAFRDRADAADHLIRLLPPDIGADWLVLALPRGGVPVAAAIARHLGAAFDLVIVRKVGVPGDPELAVAAVTGPDPSQCAINERVQAMFGLSDDRVRALARAPVEEVARRRARWLAGRPETPVRGRDVLIVDDGVATGTTLMAAVQAVRAGGARKIAVAVPVALGQSLQPFSESGVDIICPFPHEPYSAVALAYDAFPQVSDDDVTEIIEHFSDSALR